jgi:DNA-directed RNA polymerase subunit M/transcription elongation factor TFIIS
MNSFKVIQCPNCGNIQVSQTESVFKCFKCGKSKTYNPKSKLGLGVKILASFSSGAEATKYVQEYKRVKYDL